MSPHNLVRFPETSEELEPFRADAIRLAKYLRELVKLRVPAVYNVDNYAKDGAVIWFHSLPAHPDCRFVGRGDFEPGQDDVWLEVRRQKVSSPPQPNATLARWIHPEDMENLWTDLPPLLSQIEGPLPPGASEGADPPMLRYEEFPELPLLFSQFASEWMDWKSQSGLSAHVQSLYAKLFDLYTRSRKQGERFELVVGFGLLQTAGPQAIKRHVFTAKAALSFDAARGVFTLCCPGPPRGANLQQEREFLPPGSPPGPEALQEVEKKLIDLGDAIWDREKVLSILDLWANAFNANTSVSLDTAPCGSPGERPYCTWAPALILRSRAGLATLAVYERLVMALEAGEKLPMGFAQLVTALDSRLPTPGGCERTESELDSEIYFPLPSNDEQRQIVKNLRNRQGILVQGPPGTGKSHTIANLLCHLLAEGKRVLVTSETDRALRVLREKIPKEVQNLAVSLLGTDVSSFQELSANINGINHRLASWNERVYDERISTLEASLSSARKKKVEANRERLALREGEGATLTYCKGIYTGTPSALAQQVKMEKERFEWLLPEASLSEEPPFSNDTAQCYLQLLRELTAERAEEVNHPIVPLETLPPPGVLEDWVRCEQQTAAQALERVALTRHSLYPVLRELSAEKHIVMRKTAQQFRAQRDALLGRPEQWIKDALMQILGERETSWRVIKEQTEQQLGGLAKKADEADKIHIDLSESRSYLRVLADARLMLTHIEKGGRWSIFGLSTGAARGRQYLRTEVLVDGSPPESPARLRELVESLETRKRFDQLRRMWSQHGLNPSNSLALEQAELQENVECLVHAFGLLDLKREIASQIPNSLMAFNQLDWMGDGPEVLVAIINAFEAERASEASQQGRAQQAQLLREWVSATGAHPVASILLGALLEGDVPKYTAALTQCEQLHADLARLNERNNLRKRLEKGHPSLAVNLRSSSIDSIWEVRLKEFEEAWRWRYVDHQIARLLRPGAYEKSCTTLKALDREEASLLASLAAEKAWRHFLKRLGPTQIQSLQGWQLAMQRMPKKSTGPRAMALRVEAKRLMSICVDAIPVWILPRYRVAETLDIMPEVFDLVIVDEASQTGVDGLFLFYLGKQLVIVGDDQQISPSDIGLQDAAIGHLVKQYIDDFNLKVAFYAKNSLYDNARIRFPDKVVLREHFRCVPEIIQFSNDLCYAPLQTPLVPLRHGSPERLEPVTTRFVSGGYQKGSASSMVNELEAEAIVEQLISCDRDQRYDGKSFGVISLTGSSQAQRVQSLLVQRLGPEKMEKRNLVCGDAYAFQGDERNVMFLSLVVGPNSRHIALTGDTYKQRFNVAVSRAQDQLWLFHSVQLSELGAECLRHRLLKYCLNPTRIVLQGDLSLCESQFEKDVLKLVQERGYTARTQVPALGEGRTHRYRIDIVVEGIRARLAVECDGDSWHGPAECERDMARQAQLERAGWTFVRIRASEYYYDVASATAPLWTTLNELGISPAGHSLIPVTTESLLVSTPTRAMSSITAVTVPHLVTAPDDRRPPRVDTGNVSASPVKMLRSVIDTGPRIAPSATNRLSAALNWAKKNSEIEEEGLFPGKRAIQHHLPESGHSGDLAPRGTKADWFIGKMLEQWYSRETIGSQAKTAFKSAGEAATVMQYWNACTNPNSALFRKIYGAGYIAEEEGWGQTRRKRLIARNRGAGVRRD